MSSDEDFDHEAYREYEDQLYHEESLSGSEDNLDSDVEEALYGQVHYASSLLVSEKSTPGEQKTPKRTNLTVVDGLNIEGQQKHHMDNSVIQISSDDDDDDDDDDEDVDNDSDSDNNTIGDSVCSNSLNYPEVINIFSDVNNPLLEGATPEVQLEQSAAEPGEIIENWDLNERDLGDSTVIKQRLRYYTPGKGLPHLKCYNCNEKGHLSQYCPEPKKISVCFLCGDIGHIKRNCPNELCFNCYEPGHISKQCRKPRGRPFDRCKRCHVQGHQANACPDRWRQYYLTTRPGPPVCPDRPMSPPRVVYCYNCGHEGHHGHECPEENSLVRGELPLPFVVQYDGCHMSSSRGKQKPERRPRIERKHQLDIEGFFEQGTQEGYDGVQPPQAIHQDYDEDRTFFQAPPNKIRKPNHGEDFRRVCFGRDSQQHSEFNTSYTDRILPKRSKKKKNKRLEETAGRNERIVEIVDPSRLDEGLIEEPYQTKRKKAKNHKKRPNDDRFLEDSHNNNNFISRKKFKKLNDRGFTNSQRMNDIRSFEDGYFDARRNSKHKKDRNFVSNRGFRFNNQMHGKKSNPHIFKRYTF